MDNENLKALREGAVNMLARFANLPMPFVASSPNFVHSPQDGDEAQARKSLAGFVVKFGHLHPGVDDISRYWSYVSNFRYHWRWRSQRTSPSDGQPTVSFLRRKESTKIDAIEQDDASDWITNIWNRRGNRSLGPPLDLEVDFSSGRTRIIPETLLDWLVLKLMDYRYDLAICPRLGCTTPYFVKTPQYKKYCSRECFLLQRAAQKEDWEERNRSNGARKHSARKTAGSRRGTRTSRAAKRKKLRRRKSS
jgi:hypothetical protein